MKVRFYERTAYQLSEQPVPSCFMRLDEHFDRRFSTHDEAVRHPCVILAESICARMADVEMYAFLIEDARKRHTVDPKAEEKAAILTRSFLVGYLGAGRSLLDSGASTLAALYGIPLSTTECTFANGDFWHQLVSNAPNVHRRYHPLRLFLTEFLRWQAESAHRIPPLLVLQNEFGRYAPPRHPAPGARRRPGQPGPHERDAAALQMARSAATARPLEAAVHDTVREAVPGFGAADGHCRAHRPVGGSVAKSRSFVDKKILTPAHEDYLKTIYRLQAVGDEVTNSALTQLLEVAPASATNMVKKLAELGLVDYTPYHSITLTDAGQKVALEVLRHHRLLELYLHHKLNLPWDRVHAEAELLEHVLSETLEDAIAMALGDPTVDPHGDPIPTKDGHVEPVMGIPLSRAELRQPYRVLRVLAQDPERLAYLGSMNLYPLAVVTVLKHAPFAGPLLVAVDGEHHALAHDLAEVLLVAAQADE